MIILFLLVLAGVLFWSHSIGVLNDYWHPVSFLIVFFATFFSVLIQFHFRDFFSFFKWIIVIFRPCKYHFKKDIEFVCEISDLYHQSNYDGLYFCLNSNKNHILIKSLGLVMDGVSVKQYKRLILDAIEMIKMRHKIAIFFFDQLAKFSPGIGLVGTVIGLIQVLISMDKNVSLVNGMSVALITTLYGVILSNLIFQPMAGRLLVLDQSEERYNLMLLMGFISLLEGCSSLEIKERMMMVVNSQEVEIK